MENPRRITLGGRHRAGVVEQLAKLLDGIADVGAQHVFAEELVEHLADRTLQEATPPEWPGQCQEYDPSAA